MGPLRARLKAMDPVRLDLLIALVFAAEACLELVLIGSVPGISVAALSYAGVAFALAVRRRWPLASLVLGLAFLLIAQPLSREINDNVYSLFLAILFLLFSFGLNEPDGRRLVVGLVITFVAQATSTVIDSYPSTVADLIIGGLIISLGPILLARVLRNRSRLNATLREKAERLRRERTEQAELAAVEERTRIAGELHDVVAHAMSAMVVQAGGARRLAAKDPERARHAFAAVEETGREALTDIRRLLGVLRREDEEIALAPQPSLRYLDALAAQVREAGLPVDLSVEGEPTELPPGVDLSAYRIVQEALTNALKHAGPATARVVVRYRENDLELEIADTGAGASTSDGEGHGLAGMRERVSLYGGKIETGPRDGGGFAVRARLPLDSGRS